jgi:hypothetical protein
MTVWIVLGVIGAVILAWSWGYNTGKLAESMEHEDTREIFQRGLHKIDKINNWSAHLRNIGGNEDLDAVFVMATRLIACGVDPKDLMTIDRIGMAYAEGKFEITEAEVAEFQSSLDKIKQTEES